jgi:hypothetical protein
MLIQLPARRGSPRTFVEPSPGLDRRVSRALDALGDLDLPDLPGLPELGAALVAIADELQDDPDLEPEEDADCEEERLPLFAAAGLLRR